MIIREFVNLARSVFGIWPIYRLKEWGLCRKNVGIIKCNYAY